jgi:hypothetical protein
MQNIDEILASLPLAARSVVITALAEAYLLGLREAAASEIDRRAYTASTESAPANMGRGLACVLSPTSAPSSDRLKTRNNAILIATALLYGELPRTARAKALARDLANYISSPAWHRDREFARLPEDIALLRRSMHAIARLNLGETLGWRQIVNVID